MAIINSKIDKSEHVVVFSHPKTGVIIVNNFDKIGLVGTIIVFLIVYFNLVTPKYPIFAYILSFMPLLASLIVVIAFSRFAYQISFDLDKNEITFFMFRNKGCITLNMENIENVYMNMYITFIFNDKKIKYNEVANKKLVALLQSKTRVVWGFWGRIFQRETAVEGKEREKGGRG